MGQAMELLTFNDTDAPAAFAAMTNNTGNSNIVRNASGASKVQLLTAWGMATGQAINVRIRSPLMHDNQQGLRFLLQVAQPFVLLDPKFPEDLFPQDTLLIEDQSIVADAGTNVHVFSMLVYYQDLPGIAANLVSPDYVGSKTVHKMTGENTIATTATGDYGGEEAITAELNQFKANTYYALVGFLVDVFVATVRWRGVDTGNLGVGGPGSADDPFFTQNFFVWLSERSGKPCIPAFNSANAAAVLIDMCQDEAGANPICTQIFHQLRN